MGISDTATVVVIPTIVPTLSVVNDNCYNTPAGEINIAVTGGLSPIEYQITGPVNDQNQTGNFTNLPSGLYTINVWPNGHLGCVITLDTTLVFECGIDDTTICEGDTAALGILGFSGYTFTWDTQPNMIFNTGQDSAWVHPNVTTTYVIYLDDGLGNITTDSATVTVIPTIIPSVDVTDNTCLNTPNGAIDISITGGSGPITYDLLGPPNFSNTTGDFAPLPAGTYTATITPDDHPYCAITFDTTVSYISPDTIYLVGDTSACLGDTIFLSLVGADNYDVNWSTGDTTTSIIYYSLVSGNINVTINTGCENVTINTGILIHPIPIIDAGPDTSINVEEIIQLNGSGGFAYLWQPTTGLDCFTCPNPFASPVINTTYTLTAMDVNGCQGTDVMSIDVNYLPLFIPTAFSPNGDGENDVLYVRGFGIRTMNLLIYDRWGKTIFTSTDKSNGWDGQTPNGNNATSGVYGYQFSATRPNGDIIELKGNITLFR